VPNAVIHSAAVFAHFMSPALYNPTVRRREYASITILNAFTLAVACWCAGHPRTSRFAAHTCLPTGLHVACTWDIHHQSSAYLPAPSRMLIPRCC